MELLLYQFRSTLNSNVLLSWNKSAKIYFRIFVSFTTSKNKLIFMLSSSNIESTIYQHFTKKFIFMQKSPSQ